MLHNEIEANQESTNRYKDRLNKFSSEFELGVFLMMLRKSTLWVLFFFLLSFTTAYLFLRYTQPVFQSKATIQINENTKVKSILNVGDAYETESSIARAVEVLKSKVFIERVTSQLNLSISYFNEGTFKSNELYKTSPFLITVKNVKGDEFLKKYRVEFNEALNGGKVFVGEDDKRLSYDFILDRYFKIGSTEFSVQLNSSLTKQEAVTRIQELKKFYFVLESPDLLIARIQNSLDVKILNEQAKTISISIKDQNPVKACDIVNAIANEYQRFDVERESESSKNILSFVENQLNNVFLDLKSTESALQSFKKNNNYSADAELKKTDMLQYSSVEDQLLKVELDERILQEIQKNLSDNKSVDPYQLVSLVIGADNELSLKEMISNLQRLLIEKENLLYQVTPNSESIKQINFKIENQRKQLVDGISSARTKMRSRYLNLKDKSNEIASKFVPQPEKDLEYARLMRLFSINEKYYTLLLEKKTEFSISKAGFVSQTIVLENATPNNIPVSPNRNSTLFIAFLVGILMSLILIFLRYFLHNEITSLNEITKHTNAEVSILGMVPKFEKEIPVSQLVINNNPKSIIAESFRTIRTNLQFISNEPGPKVIALTSTVSGEGKTFVALNLGGIISFSGKRVIIMDLDMRKPKIHKGFGVVNEKGMSTILINKHGIQECIQLSSVPNLHFITAGPIPPNPSELIISDRMSQVIEELKREYDVLIIDNPPVGLVTDGVTMIQRADYPIYVFRADYSKKNFIQILDRLQNESNIKKISVVLNSVDISKNRYGYNYGYGYGYGYGTNYGYYEEKVEKKSFFAFRKKR